MNQTIDPVAAARIRSDRYVDDIPTGGTPDEVARFKGQEDENLQCDGTIPKILSKGSLFLKVMVSSGDSDQQKIAKLGGKILGTHWNPALDQLIYYFSVTLVSKDKSILQITTNNFATFDHSLLTPSNLLHIINTMYDLMGLAALITIKLRIGFRWFFKSHPTLEWNTPLPPGSDKDHWLGLILMLVQADPVIFNRCIKPANALGNCELITYFDGSDDAFASVIYIRWELTDGSVFVTLLCAKARVTPLKSIGTPRSELSGAVTATRLTLSTVRSLPAGFPLGRIWFIGDSECILSSLEKINAPFGEYFGNRVGEVQDNQAKIEQYCPVGEDGEWWFTRSSHNAADQLTHADATPADLGADSIWQRGPSYLRGPRSTWPIDRNFATRKEEHIPQNELLKQFRCMIHVTEASLPLSIANVIDPLRTNNWHKLLRVTQFVLSWFHNVHVDDTNAALRLQQAKRLWFLSAMPDTVAAMKAGRLRELDIQDRDGIKVIQDKAYGMRKHFGQGELSVMQS